MGWEQAGSGEVQSLDSLLRAGNVRLPRFDLERVLWAVTYDAHGCSGDGTLPLQSAPGVFAFPHCTFQEYLAGNVWEWIDDRKVPGTFGSAGDLTDCSDTGRKAVL